jgi:hypothetical protein
VHGSLALHGRTAAPRGRHRRAVHRTLTDAELSRPDGTLQHGWVDQAAISIHPIVVAAEGATVGLHPLIPAPSGSQSISDVEAAIEGLAETAIVERWDGGQWVQVADVALTPPAPGESSVGRSAIIPDLEAGAYRLVRTGPAGPHTGNFWVQA